MERILVEIFRICKRKITKCIQWQLTSNFVGTHGIEQHRFAEKTRISFYENKHTSLTTTSVSEPIWPRASYCFRPWRRVGRIGNILSIWICFVFFKLMWRPGNWTYCFPLDWMKETRHLMATATATRGLKNENQYDENGGVAFSMHPK